MSYNINDAIQEKFKGKIEKTPVEKLKQSLKAASIYHPRGIAALAAAILAFGGMIRNPRCTRPDSNGDYHVLDGWCRVLAAIMLGWSHIFMEVMYDLPEEDESLFIVESNASRDKTYFEKYQEIVVYQKELPKRQGKKGLDESFNQREAIAEKMGIADSEVRDLITIGEHDNSLLHTIDGKNATITAEAEKIRKSAKGLDLSKYVAIEALDMELHSCPTCMSIQTAEIEERNGELFYKMD